MKSDITVTVSNKWEKTASKQPHITEKRRGLFMRVKASVFIPKKRLRRQGFS